MGHFIEMIDQRFGRLTVLSRAENHPNKKVQWNCRCDCGQITTVTSGHLRNGHTQSCGCFQKDQMSKLATHGHSRRRNTTREYSVWAAMKERCLNLKDKGYDNYGGRGITVCAAWQADFMAFFNDMGPCPPGYSLERIKNNEGYAPGNCKWATRKEQSRNKRSNKWLTAFGITKIQRDWARLLDCNDSVIQNYLKRGRNMEWILRHFQRVG